MDFGAAMFFTDYSMAAGELAQALETRGFESLWAPEHSHIPVSRASPFPSGGDLPKQYHDVMDPFVTLTAAAAVTKTLKIGTGVCLVQQRDPIQTAKLVASIDQVSAGRFLFGVGSGWNAEEMADHGTDVQVAPQGRARAHRGNEADLDREPAAVPRRIRELRSDDGLAEAGAEAAPAGHRRWRVPLRRTACDPLRRWLGAARQPAGVWRCQRLPAAVPSDGHRSRPRSGIIAASPCSASWRRWTGCATTATSASGAS